jgi:glycine/D-amino acid oxidase-like deaminating enzyme
MSGSVVVIGAGPGGLAAAILLASTGLRVKVIGRPSVVGGRTSAISAGDSIRFGPDFFSFSARIGGDLCRGWSEFAELGGDGAVGSALSDRFWRRRRAGCDRRGFPNGGSDCAATSGGRGRVWRFLEENRDKLRRMEPCLELHSLVGGTFSASSF